MICTACLLGSALSAESIGDVEFQFPPSNYEWKLFIDHDFYSEFRKDEEEFSEESEALVKIFTHREGDALELFVAAQFQNNDEEDELDTLMSAQKEIDESLNCFLPNHHWQLLSFEESKEEGFCEWELNDAFLDLVHGYSRVLQKDGITTVLFYLTTAVRTEYNRVIWSNILKQAH